MKDPLITVCNLNSEPLLINDEKGQPYDIVVCIKEESIVGYWKRECGAELMTFTVEREVAEDFFRKNKSRCYRVYETVGDDNYKEFAL